MCEVRALPGTFRFWPKADGRDRAPLIPSFWREALAARLVQSIATTAMDAFPRAARMAGNGRWLTVTTKVGGAQATAGHALTHGAQPRSVAPTVPDINLGMIGQRCGL